MSSPSCATPRLRTSKPPQARVWPEGIRRLRAGEVQRRAGYDGAYGTITLLTPAEIEQISGQMSLFAVAAPAPRRENTARSAQASPRDRPEAPAPAGDRAQPRQQAAVEAQENAIAVVAGPGTGKTKTLVARIAHLIAVRGVKPDEITAVTFTNQAAAELRTRLAQQLGGKRAMRGLTAGTFHAICLHLLGEVRLLSQGEALTIAGGRAARGGAQRAAPGRSCRRFRASKNGAACAEAGIEEALYQDYCAPPAGARRARLRRPADRGAQTGHRGPQAVPPPAGG